MILISVFQRLAGATLLVFANKQDLPGALEAEEIRKVSNVQNVIMLCGCKSVVIAAICH